MITLVIDKPWQQHPEETALAYKSFQGYLELGPDRRLTNVVRKYNEKESYISQLAR